MSGPHKTARDPKAWIRSPKRVWYWRHPTQSSWKGPRDDRVWVPSIDAPDDLEPPPDDDDDDDIEMGTSVPTPVFGSLPHIAPTMAAANAPPPPVMRAPPQHQQAPTHSGPPHAARFEERAQDPYYQGGPYPRGPSHPPREFGPFTGPFANTMRYKAEQERARDERGHTNSSYQGRRDENPPHGQYRPGPPPPDDRRREETRERRDDERRFQTPPRTHRPDVRDEYTRSRGPDERREEQRAEAQAHQERAREAALRAKAVGSRPHPLTAHAPNTIPLQARRGPCPNVDEAQIDRHGHPVFPAGPVLPPDDDVSDYGSDDSDDELRGLKTFRAREEQRLAEQARRPGPIAPMPEPPPEAGLWARLSFATIVEAKNLSQWMTSGCPRARAMYRFVMRYHSENPGARRSDGVQYLMRDQGRAERAYLLNTTGDSTPMSRRVPQKGLSRTTRRRLKAQNPASQPDSTTTQSTGDDDEPMNPAPPEGQEPPFQQSYVGHAPLPSESSSGPLGPDASLESVLREMASRPPATWTQGIRMENGQWAAPNTLAGVRPLSNDVLAARFLGFVCPRRGQTSIDRSRWMDLAMAGLSIPGFFERMVQRGQWQYNTFPLENFPFDAANVTMSQALSWVHLHGIASGSGSLRILQDYAAAWRNFREHNVDPTAHAFRDPPRDSMDVLRLPDAQITPWREIHYGPVREGITTTTPRFPAGGIYASMHAPAAATPTVDTEMPPPPETPPNTVQPVTGREDGEVEGPIHPQAPTEIALPASPTIAAGAESDVTSVVPPAPPTPEKS
ncbi:hypothetical protein B0H15DRAFT_949262 [Mycena belliarum]|uniref:Uncharacterized protein n=1 Tax=Mycena belliarum TaxID=1033014 RepID=A0AAD6XUV2_9AGAR|nr:hypothetical protein B0H15DRAFT_949262 [Mycena belliae]